ncbi:MAG: threonine/serine dehydratase [Variibacter sp.]
MTKLAKSQAATLPVSRDDIAAAANRIAPWTRRTPVLRDERANFSLDAGAPITFKLEYLQHTGSFKPRGAFNTLLASKPGAAGVAAASGGNHGAAVAYAAMRLGHKATIFVPETSSPVKIAQIRAHGADLRVGGARYADALEACDAFIAATGALSVHAYDTVETIAGQGTVGREWEETCADLDTLLVGVGGGGLIAGIAAWYAGRVKVVGVEPKGSRCLHAALEAGAPVDVPVESIAADSLGAKRTGDLVFEIARSAIADVVLVEDEAITQAQATLWQRLRVAAEPGGAAAAAALFSGAYRPQKDERVGVLLCGANVDLAKLATLTT